MNDHQASQTTWDPDTQYVVLLDLDGTLIDSEKARQACWAKALGVLIPLLHCSLDEALAAYQAIYQSCRLLAGVRGPRGHIFEDMRQEWNVRSSYGLLIALLKESPPSASPSSPDAYVLILQRLFNDSEEKRHLLQRAEDIMNPWAVEVSVYIDRAMREFWEIDWAACLFPGVKALLSSLASLQISYYVATEGHLPTQWKKISCLGLDVPTDDSPSPLLPHERLLATSQAARPDREVRAIHSLIEWYRGLAAANEEAARLLQACKGECEMRAPSRKQVSVSLDIAQRTANGLKRLLTIVDGMARKLYVTTIDDQNGARRILPEFYLRSLFSISQSPANPRLHMSRFQDVCFREGSRIRLAMVGDNYNHDIEPILDLSKRLNAKIMPICITAQSRYGKDCPENNKLVHRLAKLADVKDLLLDPAAWAASTTPITGCPHGVFLSTIHPNDLADLIVAIASVEFPHPASSAAPQEASTLARTFIREMRTMIVADIAQSTSVPGALARLLVLYEERFDSHAACPGFKECLVSLIIDISRSADDFVHRNADGFLERDLVDHGYLNKSLHDIGQKLVPGDDVSDEWASAVISVLHADAKARAQMCKSTRLARLFSGKLAPFTRNHVFPFPTSKADDLKAECDAILRQRFPDKEFGQDSETGEPADKPGNGANNHLILGVHDFTNAKQQLVHIGSDQSTKREIYCSLCGAANRNIVCICGAAGTGKSTTLTLLVRGALNGQTLMPKTVEPASVIVFHMYPSGPCDLVTKKSINNPAFVFSPENELSAVTHKYTACKEVKTVPLKIVPLKFRLCELGSDTVLNFLELKSDIESYVRHAFAATKGLGERVSIKDVIAAISNEVGQSERNEVLNRVTAAFKRIESFITNNASESFVSMLKSGHLHIIDCGGEGAVERTMHLRAWGLALASLEARTKNGKMTLLVFDEMHLGFAPLLADPLQQPFSDPLNLVADRLGRHGNASILLASQTAKDFCQLELARNATILLVHNLGNPSTKQPDGNVWKLFNDTSEATFLNLERGQAWYGSAADHTGIVQVASSKDH